MSSHIRCALILSMSFACCSYASENVFQQQTLRTGFYLKAFPDISMPDMEVALRFWTEEVGKEVGIPATVYVYRSLDKMRTDFYQDKINFIVASPLAILNKIDLEQLADGYKIFWSGTSADKLLVITHKQSALKNFKSVKNKQLSMLLNEPISEMYADVLALKDFGKKANHVFKKINHERKSNQLIYKLFFKNTDVILVYKVAYDLSIELNPQISLQTQIISTLPNMPRALGFFHRRVEPKFRETVINAVGKLDAHPRGQQLLALFQADKTVRSSITDLQTTQQLKQRYQKLINQTRNR